jgi:hypothetical protein
MVRQRARIRFAKQGELRLIGHRDLVRTIERTVGRPLQVEHKPLPQDDPARRRPDLTRAREILGYRPTVDLEQAGGIAVPREISIYAIEVGDGVDRSGDLAEILREAVPRLVAQIVQEEFGAVLSESDWY